MIESLITEPASIRLRMPMMECSILASTMIQPSAMAVRSKLAAHDLARRQVPGVGVDRRARVEEIELRDFVDEVEVRVEGTPLIVPMSSQ